MRLWGLLLGGLLAMLFVDRRARKQIAERPAVATLGGRSGGRHGNG